MTHTVFFSWQLDRLPTSGRNFIESALQKAVGRLGADVEEAVRDDIVVDKDTKGVPGQPPIVDTIFKKIDSAAVFVPDLTFVGTRSDGRPSPNPNVLIEYGWALKTLGHFRIVPVMNVAFGEPSDATLPFDMKHLRHPLTYNCPENADAATRSAVKEQLAKELEKALRAVLESPEFQESLPKPSEPPRFPAAASLDGEGRFRANGTAIGLLDSGFPLHRENKEVYLADGAVMWLRVMPASDPGRRWKVAELKAAATTDRMLLPLTFSSFAGDLYWVRGGDGFGVFSAIGGDPATAHALVYAFGTGEVWSADSYILGGIEGRTFPWVEEIYAKALDNHCAFLDKLGCEPPYYWIAGLEDLNGRPFHIPPEPSRHYIPGWPQGRCVCESIVVEGERAPGQGAAVALLPFFEKVFDVCGAERPPGLATPRSE